jgi:hypothetical protein
MSWVGDGKTYNEGNGIDDRVLIEWSKDGFFGMNGVEFKGVHYNRRFEALWR